MSRRVSPSGAKIRRLWLHKAIKVTVSVALVKQVLLLLVIGPSDYLGTEIVEGAYLVMGIEIFLFVAPAVFVFALIALRGRRFGKEVLFRIICHALLLPVSLVGVIVLPNPWYLLVSFLQQITVTELAVRNLQLLRLSDCSGGQGSGVVRFDAPPN